MGITGVYYEEHKNLEDILEGNVQPPTLDIDKTWSLIVDMFPDIPLVPVGEQYKVDSQATEYGSFYLPADKVAEIAAQIPELKQPENLTKRIDFEKWKNIPEMDIEQLDERAMIMLAFPMQSDETYEELVDGYLLPHLESVFELFEKAFANQSGLVFMIM
ncbi:hypothetical protein PQ460_19345 [Paenibacillus sp. KACC 21273]|uniref:hypothetical protein n=1 Tax=Paenibacillus sp. KACC 21273 TaxID=3025665 RepID=UPI00236651EC|nr:hypothetical protein [Paenibacillus sp. KACC 21273]WDF50119.1 hypothetical protein PQ460_19345 [Paenibacillus sp. KACC 21273]